MSDPLPADELLPDEPLPDEAELFGALDHYVDQIHRGEVTRSQVLLNHPELAKFVGCLEALDGMASQIEESINAEVGSDDDPDQTVDSGSSRDRGSSLSGPRFCPGESFGRYELEGEIGRGGMGVIFKARQKDLDRPVALKMILASHLASASEIDRFYREAQAAGGLRHPNVVGIHEVGEIDGQHYFCMDHIEGESLAERLRRGCPNPTETATLLAQVARAVCFLHQRDIIHRDLKPSNVLLDESGLPFVTDFGLAKVHRPREDRTRTGTIIGTASYMSPEQARGEVSKVGPRSDIYSLGTILYEMLTGQPPVRGETLLDTLQQVIESEPPEPRKVCRTVPRELELICLKCLEKSPEKRYADASELAADLEAFSKGDSIAIREPSFTTEVRRWARRHPALASRLAGILICVLFTQMAYMLWGVDFPYHMRVMGLFGLWAVLAVAYQKLSIGIANRGAVLPYLWSATDAAMLTVLLAPLDAPLGPLLIGYPLLVTASGLFFNVRLVGFMTVVCLIALGVLFQLRPTVADFGPIQYPLIFAGILTIIGGIVAYQVYRFRRLTEHYES